MRSPDADVIVVGVGTMGSATLWRLATRGVRVIGIEQFEPGHDRGSGHGESRIIRTAYHEHPAYVPLVREAWRLWRSLEAETGASLLTRTGALMIGPSDGEVIAGVMQAVRTHGLAHEVLTRRDAADRFPQHVLSDGDVAVLEPDAGFLRPELAITTMAAAAGAAGARLETGTKVVAIEPAEDGVIVRLADGVLTARHAVVCAGAWLANLVSALKPTLLIERQVPMWFPVGDAAMYEPSRFPVFIRQADDHLIYGIPSLDGATVKVALHHEGVSVAGADDVDRSINDFDVEAIAPLVERCLDGVRPTPARAVTCLYTNTPDGHFLIGPIPGMPHVTLVSACSGHGFKFAPVVGDVAADLALHGRTSHPIEIFGPARLLRSIS